MALYHALSHLTVTSNLEECMSNYQTFSSKKLTGSLQYRRKSVEGLSMFLFVFAFLGNTFYVLSILTSPSMSEDFLLESTPYLLGSGGTLLFDVTIVIQSFLYRSRPHHHHHLSHSYPYHAEGLAHDVSKSQEDESRPLLDGAVERGPLSIETQEIHRRRETGTSGVEDDRHVS